MAVSVNLLPDIKQQRLKAQRRKRNMVLIALGIMTVGIAMPVLAGLTIGTQQVLLNRSRSNNESGIAELKEVKGLNEALTAQNQLNGIYNLSNAGEDFRSFYTILENAISPAATIQSLSITSEGNLEIIGTASDVDAVNVVVKSLSSFTPAGLNLDKFDEDRQTFFDQVRVVSIQPAENDEGASFNIETIFNFSLLDTVSSDLEQSTNSDESPFSEGEQ